MEISIGNFYFYAEKTTAMIIALIPVVLIMQIPVVQKMLFRVGAWLKVKAKNKYNQDMIDRKAER